VRLSTNANGRRGSIGLALAILIMVTIGVQSARAGTWMLVSCVNPNGSAAPSDGWSAFSQGQVTIGDGSNTHCAPGVPLEAELGNQVTAVNGQSQVLQFTPPSGSTLIGGTLSVHTTAFGGHTDGAAAEADVLEPTDTIDAGDAVFLCVDQSGCGSAAAGDPTYTGPVALPADRGGNVYVTAICTALSGSQCDENVQGNDGSWARAQVNSADILLSNLAAPQSTDLGGNALRRGARGTAHFVFTATDAGGPGIYAVTAAIDGATVFSGTPNTNGGACVPVGTDTSGALMFDFAQPCPPTEVVDVPIPTAGLADGAHNLTVNVIDAAQNASTVYDDTITTSNPQTTPNPKGRRALHARFVISWRWKGATTLLRSLRVTHLLRGARVAVRCSGKHCPRIKGSATGSRRVARLLRRLGGRRLRAGQTLLITVTARRHTAERIAVTIRKGHKPNVRLLR
jgi:hypothetical protein